MLNNRPLGNVSSDPRSPEPLTPNHLLLARANPNLPPDVFDQKELSSKKKWRATEALMDQFWKRWQTEWVPSLIKRQKWVKEELGPSLEYSRLTLAPTESSARCGSGSNRPNYIAPLSIYASSKPKKKKKSRFLW